MMQSCVRSYLARVNFADFIANRKVEVETQFAVDGRIINRIQKKWRSNRCAAHLPTDGLSQC